jgi:molybdenum cofactor guanylyltransferase
MKIRNQDIEAYILAGGESRRMGADKGLMPLKAIPMVKYVIEVLEASQYKVKLISGNEAYQKFGLPVYKDVIPGKGPMGGLLTALQHAEKEYVLLIGCDMPFISKGILERLIENSKAESITVAETNGKINPLLAIYPRNLLKQIQENIKQGNLKMQDFILENHHQIVPMDSIGGIDPIHLTNINTKEELLLWNHKLNDGSRIS